MTSLRTVRRRKLLSQRDLADKAGITTSTVYLTEAGKSTPRLQVMRKLSEALEIDPMEVDEFRSVIEQPRKGTRLKPSFEHVDSMPPNEAGR